jgi:glycosyltransferase involved in cell wall biosynthesis
MASRSLIAAHDNPFNRSVLQQDALYFSSTEEVASIIKNNVRDGHEMPMINNNLKKIKDQFSWENVIRKYEDFIQRCVRQKAAGLSAQTASFPVKGKEFLIK